MTDTWMRWGQAVLHLSGRGALLIVVVIVMRALLRRWVPAGLIHAFWLVAAGALLLPWRVPLPAGWRPEWELARPGVAAGKVPAPAARAAASPASGAAPAPAGVVGPGAPAEPPSAPDVFQPGAVAAGVWLFGVATLLAGHALGLLRFRQRVKQAIDRGDERVERMVAHCSRELGLRRQPPVLATGAVHGPALHGLWRPCLLVPRGLADGLDETELAWVVRHELAHLQRHDLWAQAWVQLAAAIHWFNPLAWLAVRLARQDGELACDSRVLRNTGDGAAEAYGRTLLKMIDRARPGGRRPAALGLGDNRRHLRERFARIADHRRTGRRGTALGLALLAGVAVAGYTRAGERAPTAVRPDAERARRLALVRDGISWQLDRKLRLRAVGAVNGEPVALIDAEDQPHIVNPGTWLLQRTVNAIDVERGEVRVTDRYGKERTLRLEDPRPIAFPQLFPDLVDRIVNDELPPNFYEPRDFPGEVLQAWDRINREGKEAIMLNFLSRGLVFNVEDSPTGIHGQCSIGRLFVERTRRQTAVRRDAFLASLTPEQRAVFQRPLAGVRIGMPSGESSVAAASAAAAESARNAMLASFTPEQRRLYDAWMRPGGLP